jgi:hypothetical protein
MQSSLNGWVEKGNDRFVLPFVVWLFSTMFMGISAMFVDMNVGVGDAFIIKNNPSVAHATDPGGYFL